MTQLLQNPLLGVLLLIALFVYARRRAKLRWLTAGDFPRVPARDFLEWRGQYVLSTDIVLASTVITFVPVLIIRAFYQNRPEVPTLWLWILAIAVVIWLGALVHSAVIGTRASRRAKQLGIEWRKRV